MLLEPGRQRRCGETATGDAVDVHAVLRLPDLVLADRVVCGQDAADHVGVDGHAAVPECVVGPSLDARLRPAAGWGGVRAGEPVGELVADQRLGEVVQVVTSTLAEATPAGTGLLSSSTSSAR